MSVHSSNATNYTSPFLSTKDDKLKALSQKKLLLIKAMSDILNEEIEINEIKHHFSKKDLFYSKEVQFNSIEEFITKLMDYLKIERSTLILSYISMKKFLRKDKNYLTLNNIMKLFLTSCFINAKYNEDQIYNESRYSRICELTIKELATLENEYCRVIDYRLFVDEKLFDYYYSFFERKEKEYHN